MRESTIAERYAIALLDIGIEKGIFENLATELTRVADLLNNSSDLHRVFTHPRFNADQRKKVFGKLLERLSVCPTIRNFAFLLVDRNRILSLPAVLESYQSLVDRHLGRVRAEVIVARKLNPMDEKRLIKALKAVSDQEILIEQTVDPSILGGLVARVGGRVYDGSLKTRLASIGSHLRSS
jgi:F-type H+-transporting ATPase subunit delta